MTTTDQYVRITLQQSGSWGVCLHEVEIYSATSVPAAGLLPKDGWFQPFQHSAIRQAMRSRREVAAVSRPDRIPVGQG
ncbi:MAG: hypothetical protein EBZ18_01505 [Alphaproteobacteria bacterium]|nr:hypothetical protein [Alphaproteobacteria bacterium]